MGDLSKPSRRPFRDIAEAAEFLRQAGYRVSRRHGGWLVGLSAKNGHEILALAERVFDAGARP